MKYFISVKNRFNKYQAFEVPEEVKRYIIQLECHILSPKNSKLKELYKERFGKNSTLC